MIDYAPSGHVAIPLPPKQEVLMPTSFIQVSKVKALIKASGLRVGKDFIYALNHAVEQHISCAISKVTEDGKRKTLGAEDI